MDLYTPALLATPANPLTTANSPTTAYLDSGCSSALTPHAHLLADTYSGIPHTFTTAGGSTMVGTGTYGRIRNLSPTHPTFSIPDMELVPSAAHTLLSVFQLLQQGQDVWFDHQTMTGHIGSLDTNASHTSLLTAPAVNGTFQLTLLPPTPLALLSPGVPTLTTPQVWHSRYLHCAHQYLAPTAAAVKGMTIQDHFCAACVKAKITVSPYKISDKEYDFQPGERISVDIVQVPDHYASLGGATKAIGFRDKGSELGLVFPVKTKSEAANRI
ncbi:hypothetical protein HDU67_006074, partial [Dinochytrium kinnereticum]